MYGGTWSNKVGHVRPSHVRRCRPLCKGTKQQKRKSEVYIHPAQRIDNSMRKKKRRPAYIHRKGKNESQTRVSAARKYTLPGEKKARVKMGDIAREMPSPRRETPKNSYSVNTIAAENAVQSFDEDGQRKFRHMFRVSR